MPDKKPRPPVQGRIVKLRDRWYYYRLITITFFGVLGVVVYIFLTSDLPYTDTRGIGQGVFLLDFIFCGLTLSAIETVRIFLKKKN